MEPLKAYSDSSPFHLMRETATDTGIRIFLLSVSANTSHIDLSFIPEEQLIAISRYRVQHDREKRLLARSFLYHHLKTVHGVTRFDTLQGPYKKPMLRAAPQIQFSISYSGDYILTGISTTGPSGVDIECINEQIDVADIAPTIMCAEELQHFRQLPTGSAEQYRYFYSVFSAKEPIIKAFGTGLYYDILSINTIRGNTFSYEGQTYTNSRIFTDEPNCCIYCCRLQGS